MLTCTPVGPWWSAPAMSESPRGTLGRQAAASRGRRAHSHAPGTPPAAWPAHPGRTSGFSFTSGSASTSGCGGGCAAGATVDVTSSSSSIPGAAGAPAPAPTTWLASSPYSNPESATLDAPCLNANPFFNHAPTLQAAEQHRPHQVGSSTQRFPCQNTSSFSTRQVTEVASRT